MERVKRAVSLVLCLVMVLGFLPVSAFAATADDALTAALSEAQSYIDGITVNSSSNDPETVVKNFKTHFTWDNEKRESSQSYLFDWSYYNGVVFEGLEYLYEVTGNEDYKNYVLEYMSSLIAGDGTWAKCSNNSSKECAGYNATHGADCYKTASLLLDAYELSGDGRYLTMANTLYADLDSAAATYSLSECGGNYRHTWASDPSPDLWLDGLYMILPFRAEYAKHVGDTEELDLIVSRMQWVSDNMYDSSKGLFYHAADSATSNSGTFWLRSIGWYAAAIVDVMDSMEGENLETMKAQLVKLVDGMKAVQNASNGMWLNNMAASESSTNPYETSGTALVCYAVMKAVNNGWLDESYADMVLLAFKGICNEKLDGDKLTDICFKGAPGSSNSTFYDNEGKGVGPFIMLTAEVLEHVNKKANEPVIKTDDETGVSVEAVDITGLTVAPVAVEEMAEAVAEVLTGTLVAYDITVKDFTEGSTAAVTVAIPEGVNADNFAVFYVSAKGDLERMEGEAAEDGKTYTFYTTHFSTYVGGEVKAAAEEPADAVTGEGYLPGGERAWYEYVTSLTNGKQYLIVSRNTAGDGTALGTSTAGNNVTVVSGPVINDKGSAAEWTATGSDTSWSFKSGSNYLGYTSKTSSGWGTTSYSYTLAPNAGSAVNWTVSGSNVKINLKTQDNWYGGTSADFYLTSGNTWSMATSSADVYFYEKKTETLSGAAVTFTVTPGELNLMVNNTDDLSYTITLDDGTDVSSSEIEWATGDSRVATVSNGKVTAVAEGSTTITAKLNSVNGTDLVDPIELTIPVTVQNKKVESFVLTGNNPVTTKQNVEPDFSNIKLILTYDDGSKGTITVANGLVIKGYDITKIGYDYATISYEGVEYGTVRVTVEGDPYAGKEEATVYPGYPADGAVRIDKTATEIDFENTGVVKVELDVAGISVKPAVDVILVTDLSNSMAWAAGGRSDATSHEATKMYDLQQSVASFADIFLATDDDGNATKNTMSLVTFGGYDADYTNKVYTAYADPTQTLLVGSTDADVVKNTINNIRVLADDALSLGTSTTGYYLSFDGGKTYGENYGNTNYDHAFMQTTAAIAELKADYKEANGTDYDASGRQIYILFMTDGAPSNYDGVYYNYKTGDRADVNCTWINEKGEKATYTMGNNKAQYQAGPWFEYIAGGSYNNGTIPGNPLYWADQVYNTDSVANIYPIGFDIDNGGFSSMTFTEADGRPLSKVLEKLVTGQTLEVFSADDKDGLSKIYADLATKIRFAGTNANVTDIVDSNFDLQLTQITGSADATAHGDLGFKPTIEVSAYELWTKEETTDSKLIGTRKTNADGTEVVDVLETITFNEDGTAAYSNLESGNIMTIESDGTVIIEAFYFTYIGTPEGEETFKWRLGNITEKEVVLSYYAYLTGTMEGTCPKGLYYTNEEAILEYVDINDKHATQIFPIPAVAWGGASTSYEFYLVNEQGEPCDRNGNVIPFANRIIITGPYFEELYLNQADEEVAKEIVAAYVLPAGYTLYDETAKYTVITASGDIKGSLEISKPADGKVQTTILVSAVEPSYIQSRVAFGVIYNKIPVVSLFELVPDKIVIDYGLAITKNVGENNTEIEDGYTPSLVGFSKYYDSVDPKNKFTNTSAVNNFEASYGVFSIEDEEECVVRYTPTTFVNNVEKIFCVIKMTEDTNANNYYYMVDTLTVIPATIVYYETDFAPVFKMVQTDKVATSTDYGTAGVVAWENRSDGSNAKAELQEDGSIDRKQTYGFDAAYANDMMYSNSTSWFVEGEGYENTSNTFTFTGTGFEIISRTGTEQGLVRAEIFKQGEKESFRSVTVLNKSDSAWELYQIPVISVNDLEHGTYTVKLSVEYGYENASFPALDRGSEFYFDAVRIFNPTPYNAEAIEAYEIHGEAGPLNFEIREKIIAAADYDAVDLVKEPILNSAVIVDFDQEGRPNVVDYASIGPNNELYLEKGYGVAFKLTDLGSPASIDVGAKTIEGKNAVLNVSIFYNDREYKQDPRMIESATAQNYPIYNGSDLRDEVSVVIWNTGDGVLSLTDVKVAYSENPVELADITFLVDQELMDFAAVATIAAQPEPNFDIHGAQFTNSSTRVLRATTMTVVTTTDVAKLKVVNKYGWDVSISASYVDDAQGVRTWTVKMYPAIIGWNTFKVTGYGAAGETGASRSAQIYVSLFS